MSFRMSYMLLGVGCRPVVRNGSPALRLRGFLSGSLPEWGCIGNLGLGSGSSCTFGSPVGFVRRFVPGITIVLEVIV